jgi:hypothetical protein
VRANTSYCAGKNDSVTSPVVLIYKFMALLASKKVCQCVLLILVTVR